MPVIRQIALVVILVFVALRWFAPVQDHVVAELRFMASLLALIYVQLVLISSKLKDRQ